MFKVETCVLVLLTAFSVLGHAEEESTTSSGRSECVPILEGIANGTLSSATGNEDQKAAIRRCTTNSNDAADCGTAESDYKKALAGLSTSCGALGGRTGNNRDFPSCSEAITQCKVCPDGNPQDAAVSCEGLNFEEDETPRSSTASGYALRDVGAAKQLLEYCPGKLGAEQKDLEKEMKESAKEVKELEAKLPKLQQEAAQIMNNMADQVSEIQDQMANDQNQLDEDLAAAADASDNAMKQMQEQIVGFEEQIARADDNIRQVQLQKTDAEMKHDETIKQIDLNCHASASATIAKFQQDRLALERTGQFNRNSFKNMMKQVGVSDRESWQKLATKYYNWCLKSKPTKDSKDSADKTYASILRTHDEAISKLGRDKDRLRDKIKSVKGENGCPPGPAPTGAAAATEPAMCGALRKAEQAAIRIHKKYELKQNQANQKIQKAQMKAANEAQSKQAEAAVIQRQLADERTRLANLKDYLEVLYQSKSKGGGSTDGKDYLEASSKYNELLNAANNLTMCGPKTACTSAFCKGAAKFIQATGADVTYSTGIDDGTLSEPATTPPGGSGTTTGSTPETPNGGATGVSEGGGFLPGTTNPSGH